MKDGNIEIAPLFQFAEAPATSAGSRRVQGTLSPTGTLTNRQKLRDAGLEVLPDWRDDA
ncbi:hypothetical protein D3C76_1832260 [compost metagenome]